MDSTRPIPFQAAVAYGLKTGAQLRRANQPAGATIQPPITKASAAAKLVSGKVDSPVSRGQGFDAPRAPMPNSSGALQMYSRAADRVEVATAAHLGRILDTRA
ncbi:MAG: hypothetical protein RLZZ116_2656 [Planctomycetota bacterium]|jgi:hypothetical protein